jgi:site-specific recombinase XerD
VLPHANAKSRTGRTLGFDHDTQQAFRRYLRRLERYEDDNCRTFTGTDRVLVGRLGPMSADGIGQMLTRRARAAGVNITHSFRRSLAIRWLRDGRSETLLQRVAGWADQTMVHRYTKAVQVEESLRQQRELLDAEARHRRQQTPDTGRPRAGHRRAL